MFYLNTILNFGILPVLVFLTGLTAQQKGRTGRWYSRKHLYSISISLCKTLKVDSFNTSIIQEYAAKPLYFCFF